MSSSNTSTSINFANHELLLDGNACLYWPDQKLLVVSDLHLEKASYLACQGHPLPLYDTHDTLLRLQRLITLYQPEKVISLGDNIHDVQAFERMQPDNFALLTAICNSVKQWVWLLGNHDQEVTPGNLNAGIYYCDQLLVDNITFTHDFIETQGFQIGGHYHPKIRVKGISGKCFLINENKIIMPAFGSFTGGFDIESFEFKQATRQENFNAYLVYNNKLWRVK